MWTQHALNSHTQAGASNLLQVCDCNYLGFHFSWACHHIGVSSCACVECDGMCVYACLHSCRDPASPICAQTPHHLHHLGGFAAPNAGNHITANHIFMGNSISPTHWDDLYPDTGLYLAPRIVSQIEKASREDIFYNGSRAKYRNVRWGRGEGKIFNVWVFQAHSGAKHLWLIWYALPCGMREIHLHINATVQVC